MKTLVVFLCMLFGCSVAYAGQYADNLSSCMVAKTTQAERIVFIQWVYAAMSAHPAVKAMSRVTPQQAEALNRKVADLVTDIITVRCRQQAREANQNEGQTGMGAAFNTLGQVAMQGLMTDPSVAGNFVGLQRYLDPRKFQGM